MNTTLLLLIQFQSPTLTMGNIRSLLGGKAEQTIRNKVSAGEFPRPTKDGVWMIQDVADYLDNSRQRTQ